MAASEAAPKSLEGSWDTTEAGKHEMGSGRKRGRDIIAGHSVDAYQVAGFFRRKAKVQKQEERKGKKLERSPQLQSWKWWGGDPMWWLAEEAIRKAEKKHGKKFGRCDKGRGKNPIVDEDGFLPIEEKDVDEYERRATDFAYALIELFEANDVPYLIKFGLKGTSAVEIYAKGKRRTTMLPSRYEFVIQTGAPLPETDVNALFESTGFDELMYYDGWESGSYGDDPQVWPSNFWYENEDGNCGWTTTGHFASKVYGPRFMSPDVEEHYELVEVEGCAMPQYQLKPKSKRNLNVLKRRLNVADPNEIRWAIDAKLQDLADQAAAQSQSYRFDYEEETDKAEEDGYDPSTLIKVASYGDAIAVDGDLLVPPHIIKLLNLKPPKHRVMLWTEASKGASEDAWSAYYVHLRGTGYDSIAGIGGADPTGSSQELSVDTIVDAVLDEWDVSDQGDKPTPSEVQNTLAQYGIGTGDLVYWESSAGDIEWVAKFPSKTPASKRSSRMRSLNALKKDLMRV